MYHEKIFNREDGTQYKITIVFITDMWGGGLPPEYTVSVTTRQKGKRKWHALKSSLGFYTRRKTHPKVLRKCDLDDAVTVVTKEEILQVKLELWEKLHPTLWEEKG